MIQIVANLGWKWSNRFFLIFISVSEIAYSPYLCVLVATHIEVVLTFQMHNYTFSLVK